MCGIAAVLDAQGIERGFENSLPWTNCLESLAKRGPDGQGTWISQSRTALLGHTRLSIIDLSPSGSQPMDSHSGQVCITYNGELYNAPDIRAQLESLGVVFKSQCDTEVLLNAWIQWGKAMLPKLHGMFAFVVWDEDKRQLFGAVDHAGMKPLVWKQEGSRALFASDCDSLRAISNHVEQLCPTAVRHVLTMSCCPPPLTMWEGIYKLQPGHQLEWSPGQPVQVSRYYTPPEHINEHSTLDTDSFDTLWEQVISDHMTSDVPVGAFLSGGIDSAATVIAAKQAGSPPTCYTLEMEGEASEHLDAQRIAQQLNLPFITQPMDKELDSGLDEFVRAYDEPQGFSALLTMVKVASLAAGHVQSAQSVKSVKSIIGGDGGDETFGGYLWQRETGASAWQHWHQSTKLIKEQSQIAAIVADPDADDQTRAHARSIFGSHSFTHGYIARVFPGFHPSEAHAMTSSWSDAYNHEVASHWLANEDRPNMPHLRRVQRLDLVGFCPASILPKVDRGAMNYGLEVRSPMLDRRLIEVGLTQPIVPCELIEDGSQSRPQLREYVSSRVGPSFVTRPKQGFSVRTSNELKFWRTITKHINEMKLVKLGMLNSNWADYVPFGDMTRLRLICMLAHWAEPRL